MTLDEATDVFCHGFCYTKSFTFPHETHRFEGLRILRDVPPRPKDERNQEIVVCGLSPEEAIAKIRAYEPPRHFLSVIIGPGESVVETRLEYKRLGYRATGSESMMTLATAKRPPVRGAHWVDRVTTEAQAEQVRIAAGARQILPEDLRPDAPLRLYCAIEEGEPVGWVRSIETPLGYNWVSNMYVLETHRRRGIGRELMSVMLEDDHASGVPVSVLLASKVGRKLYLSLGYEQIGTLLLFAPVQRP